MTLNGHTADGDSAAPPPRRARRGAPQGNTNAGRHGCTLSELPRRMTVSKVDILRFADRETFRRELN